MAQLLPSTTYTPLSSPPARRTHNVIGRSEVRGIRGNANAEYTAQTTTTYPQNGTSGPDSPLATPKASILNRQRRQPEFDELYDVTDDEALEVPLKCSNSVIKDTRRRGRYPSLVIPSPTAWPNIHNVRKNAPLAVPPTPPAEISVSPAVLQMLESYSLQVPGSAAPSLDGSMTSEEMASMSCPSTPDTQNRTERIDEWDAPVQLHPEAMETLHQLSREGSEAQEQMMLDQVIEVPEHTHQEMQEVHGLVCPPSSIEIVVTPIDNDDCDLLSALSVPSPGGFFSSLGETTRRTWASLDVEPAPSTTTAEQFYGVPWKMTVNEPAAEADDAWSAADDITLRDTASRQSSYASDGGYQSAHNSLLRPIVSRQESYTSTEIDEVAEIEKDEMIVEYKEDYQDELLRGASVNIDRTTMWLTSQTTFDPSSPEARTPVQASHDINGDDKHSSKLSLADSIGSPSKKSVRFADDTSDSPKEAPKERATTASDSTFYQSFQKIQKNARKADAFISRQARAEAVRLNRLCCAQKHQKQLLGRYEVDNPTRPVQTRPISSFYTADASKESDAMIKAEKKCHAIEQIQHSAWNLQAIKMLNGGKMLSSPALSATRSNGKTRILDLGGQTTCDWAWQMAIENREATVYTVTDKPAPTMLRGPSNHRVILADNFFKFPFPDAVFDVISARTLSSFLKIYKPNGYTADEYDLCLQECMRCLKPGGYLEYSLLDADIVNGGNRSSALSVEFHFNLKTRGYDPLPTKSFIGRLKKAGFDEIKRAWVVLPMAQPSWKKADQLSSKSEGSPEKAIGPEGDVTVVESPLAGSTADVSNITGIAGAWAWEKWMLKLNTEMGRDESRLLEGVSAVLEEGGERGAGWKCLTGWARKPVA